MTRVGFPHTFTRNKTHCYDISITEGMNIAEAEQIVMKWLIIAQATWDGAPTWVTDRSANTHSLGIVWHVRHLQKNVYYLWKQSVDLTEWHKWESPLVHSDRGKKWCLHMFNRYLISMFLHFTQYFIVLKNITVSEHYVTACKCPTKYELQLDVFTDWSCVQVYILWRCLKIFWWTQTNFGNQTRGIQHYQKIIFQGSLINFEWLNGPYKPVGCGDVSLTPFTLPKCIQTVSN